MSLNVLRLTLPRSVLSARRLQPRSLLAFPRVEFHPSPLFSLFHPSRRRRLRRCRIKPQCWRLTLTWLRSGHHPEARDLPGSFRITLPFAFSFCFFPVPSPSPSPPLSLPFRGSSLSREAEIHSRISRVSPCSDTGSGFMRDLTTVVHVD